MFDIPERTLSAESIIDRLTVIFSPIYERFSHTTAFNNTQIGIEVAGMSNLAIIEKDIRRIGQFFADADALGARAELVLLAECIAQVRVRESKLPSSAIIETEIDKTLDELSRSPALQIPSPFTAPLIWRLAMVTQANLKNYPTESTMEVLKEALSDLADLFVLRDGNLTPNESEKLKEYNATLSR